MVFSSLFNDLFPFFFSRPFPCLIKITASCDYSGASGDFHLIYLQITPHETKATSFALQFSFAKRVVLHLKEKRQRCSALDNLMVVG